MSGYQSISRLGEEHGTSTGTQTLTIPSGVDTEWDLLILVVQTQAGQGISTTWSPDWTHIDNASTGGSGAGTSRIMGFAHVYDGSTAPDVNLPDGGNHTMWAITAYRGLTHDPGSEIRTATASKSTGNTTQRGEPITGDTSGEDWLVQFSTGLGNNHGGESSSWGVTALANLFDRNFDTAFGSTVGSDSSIMVASGKSDGTKGSGRPEWTTTNTCQEARLTMQIPAHFENDYTRTATDGVGSSDSVGRTGGAFTRVTTAAASFADAASSALNPAAYVRVATDALGASDAAVRLIGLVRNVTDSVDFAEVISKQKGLFRLATDSLAVSDAITSVLVWGVRAALKTFVERATKITTFVEKATNIKTYVE